MTISKTKFRLTRIGIAVVTDSFQRNMFLTIFNKGAYWHLSQSSIRHSIYFSLIVKSRSNPFLEQTSTKQQVSCSRKQRRPLMGLEPTTSTLRVRRATHCATPPLKLLNLRNSKNKDFTIFAVPFHPGTWILHQASRWAFLWFIHLFCYFLREGFHFWIIDLFCVFCEGRGGGGNQFKGTPLKEESV